MCKAYCDAEMRTSENNDSKHVEKERRKLKNDNTTQ